MIELSFESFHHQNYDDRGCCLYVIMNGFRDVLYVGISTSDVWSRWFGWGGHMTWDGNIIYGESSIGEKIENHLPDSLNWKIQLWTLNDCLEFCGQTTCDFPDQVADAEFDYALRKIEFAMIKRLRPALNRMGNLNPGKDTTPKSEKELKWERYVDEAYDEIFNQRKKLD